MTLDKFGHDNDYFDDHEMQFQYFNVNKTASRNTIQLALSKSVLADRKEPLSQDTSREYVNFSTSNYLGLAQRKEVVGAAKQALDKYGAGANGSPVLSGLFDVHLELEHEIAKFHNTESAMLCASGFIANAITLHTILDQDSVAFIDINSHGSIFWAARCSKALVRTYCENSLEKLERKLCSVPQNKRKFIVTCGVFSMTGTLAPLPALVDIAQKYGASIILDDAHGLGTIGKNGKGVIEFYNLSNSNAINLQIGTMSKSIGGSGGYIAGDRRIINSLRGVALPYLLSASLPPSVAAGNLQAFKILQKEGKELRSSLSQNAHGLLQSLSSSVSYQVDGGEAGIIALVTGCEKNTRNISKYLFENGVIAHGIISPGVRKGEERVRFNITTMHTNKEIEMVAKLLRQL